MKRTAGMVAIPAGMAEYFLQLCQARAVELDKLANDENMMIGSALQVGRAQGANDQRMQLLRAALGEAREGESPKK